MTEKAKKKNKCVSGSRSENFRYGRHAYFFLTENKNIILCILISILPFKVYKIIFFSRKTEKKLEGSPVNLGRVGLP